MSIEFPGSDPVLTVRLLRQLASDIEKISMFVPREELNDAPILGNWAFASRPRPCLVGAVTGHPILGDRPDITSEIYAIDSRRQWVRSFSRFYKLGVALAPDRRELQ